MHRKWGRPKQVDPLKEYYIQKMARDSEYVKSDFQRDFHRAMSGVADSQYNPTRKEFNPSSVASMLMEDIKKQKMKISKSVDEIWLDQRVEEICTKGIF